MIICLILFSKFLLIKSLGEALSSICQIAKVTIITKHETSVNGSKIEFDTSGRIVKISAFTRQVGTTVQIKDLFCTLTVRQRVFAENFKKGSLDD